MIQPPSSGPPIRSFVETVTLPDEITSVAGEIVTNPPCSLLKNPNQCDPMWYDVRPTYKLVYKPNYSYKMLSVYIYISINHGDNQEFLKKRTKQTCFFSRFFTHHGDPCRLKLQLSDVLWWLQHLQHGTFDRAGSLEEQSRHIPAI